MSRPFFLRRLIHAITTSPPLSSLIRWLSCAVPAATVLCLGSLAAAEPPVINGLVAYFDAADAVATTDSGNSKTEISSWQSQLGAALTLNPPATEAQPQKIPVGSSFVIRFDGDDDVLRATKTGLALDAATIIVIAAPHINVGDFRGLLAANSPDHRDYESGFTIDLGPGPSASFDYLNVEGRGFGGANNLRRASTPFGQLQIIETKLDPKTRKVRVQIDGKTEGDRDWNAQSISMEQITVGARFYTNGPGEQIIRGNFQGDLAAILIYDRVLSDNESTELRKYLEQRYGSLNPSLQATLPQALSQGVPLVKVTDAAPVQMLIPGFKVTELPLELMNVNNVRYRRDGKLVTLGYNGDIHLLSDTDQDGLEDTAKLFWKNQGSIRGPIGIVLTPPGYPPANHPKGQGVILASKGKVSMIVDRDGDDVGDEELIVAQGWQEIAQNVDAVGLAMDRNGDLYFGLGTTNYANAYLIDKDGQAAYDLKSDRGTVQRVSADWSRRETVCTGIRFPIAFDFNQQGDLFCSEQEGATWLPNGNPFDELLHIRLDDSAPQANPLGKRHYGFPPRHPRHNPMVIDEPSVFDYGPQHQSTCGMIFNEPVNGGPCFGPAAWQGDAIVCGESRGKIWRTKLIKTANGYVADSQLLACLQMLTVDACVSPRGDLIVACHSGPPDWGTGPTGIGKLYRIRYEQPDAPKPITAWASSPSEIQITFDQPLDPVKLAGLTAKTKIQYGLYVRAGDRFENLVPPYAVVKQQQLQPRYELPVHSFAITPDAKTMILHTDVIKQAVHHAVTLPIGSEEIDIDLRPAGVHAFWTADGATQSTWEGYLPHIDLDVCRTLLKDSSIHAPLWKLLSEPGTLQLETRLDYRNMLRPAIQAGAQIDYEWPQEVVTLQFNARGPDGATQSSGLTVNGVSATSLELTDKSGWTQLQLMLPTGVEKPTSLQISYSTSEDATLRAIPLHRFWQPWAPIDGSANETRSLNHQTSLPELAGGDWGRGRRLFHDQRTLCARCHAVGGVGAKIGPDLGNLVHRDYASVLRDILEPSRAINPDYLSQTVITSSGQTFAGVISSEGEQWVIADSKGEITRVAQADVEQMKPVSTSVMPQGLLDKLSEGERRDLLTYLLTPAPSMPLDSPLTAPPVRTQAEVAAVLQGSLELSRPLKPLNIVLVDGLKDHGPGEHDYPAWQRAWASLLQSAEQTTVSTAHEFPSDEQLADADIVIFFQKGSFSVQRAAKFDQYLKRGGGVVMIHWAVNGEDRVHEFAKRIGFASWGGKIKFRHGPLTLNIVDQKHPIMRNLDRLKLYDESYWKLSGEPNDVQVLATSTEDGEITPQIWIRDHQPGRVFVSIPGHYNWTFDDPLFRIVLLRGIAWSANEPLDRFNDLVTPGARMSR